MQLVEILFDDLIINSNSDLDGLAREDTKLDLEIAIYFIITKIIFYMYLLIIINILTGETLNSALSYHIR